ncbi:unnamed protein product [Pieris macdunnoughi]|uniref:Peptidase S8 pro-domain domain-containing protein n=1 Tax=Pieris macdunnoughi TaxID=345717 RepID=A0A821QNS3_9NEOP|nr:unnamed protein product [Pieris macdunnoughi]
MMMTWRWLALIAALGACWSLPETYYHNHFAIQVLDGPEHVDDIALRHGFDNHGQVSSKKNLLKRSKIILRV